MKAAVVLASLLAVAVSPMIARAQSGKFSLTNDKPGPVVIWASEASAKAGARLVDAGQADLAAKYAACVAPSGSGIIIMPAGGYETHRVTVIDGPKRGCEGNVYTRNILRVGTGKTLADEAQMMRDEHQAKMKAMKDEHEARMKAIKECGDLTLAAAREGRSSTDVWKMKDGCMTERGFPPMKFDADGKPVK